jgi:branched-subunit amino acid aminotransferase/4-amino-4-deoxychorismate lyase
MLVYLNGRFINESKATVSVNNRSFRYGDGCFETIKVIRGEAPLLPLHFDRLFSSLELLQFQLPSFFTRGYVSSRLKELVLKNGHAQLARVRVTVFRGDGGIYDAINHQPQLLIQSWSLNPENNRLNENGLVIDFFRDGHKACDAFANLKSNNYLLYAMAALHAKREHSNDVVVLNQYGNVADATIANVWIVEGNKLITPPLTEGPVNGTMRRHLLEQAIEKGFQMIEEPISTDRLLAADEMFLTNAIYGLKWVRQVADCEFKCHFSASVHHTLVAPLWQ